MKFVCMKCEAFMGFESVQVPGEQSLGVTFGCPQCGAKIAMVTNPGETAMVNALGVKIGGRVTPAEPMELTRQTLKEEPVLAKSYTPVEQQKILETEMTKTKASGGTCPFSGMIAQMQGEGSTQPTGQVKWSPAARERIERVPSFMRPMIEMGVESYARKMGLSDITPEVMDASKNDQGEMAWADGAIARLDNIPSFIRPMAKKEIERIARERGQTQVSDALMEETKSKFIGMGY